MRAMICKEYGPPESLELGTLARPELEANQIRIRVQACGVNFPDTLIIQGKYQIKPPMPFAPGGEVAGDVIEVGSEVKNLKIGDRVMALTGYGGFAEEAVTTADRAIPMPEGMDYITASGFSMVYGTSYHALVQRGQLQPGENLLVLGASGGVGLAAVEIGKALGARVIAAASSPEKLQVAKEHGADELIDYTKENLKDRVNELTDGKGADVIYDPVGGDAFDQCLRAINWGGRLLVIGFASGRIPQAPANLPLLKGSSIVGVFWGAFVSRDPKTNFANFQHLFELYGQGKLKPHVCKTYPLEQAADALNDLLERRVTGKVVLTPQAG